MAPGPSPYLGMGVERHKRLTATVLRPQHMVVALNCLTADLQYDVALLFAREQRAYVER